MPTKHISDASWKKVESETYKAVLATQTVLKETEVLNFLISKGAENASEDDYKELARKIKQG